MKQYNYLTLNTNYEPIRPSLFSRFARPGEGLRGSDAKNRDQHQPIEMKLCMSQHHS